MKSIIAAIYNKERAFAETIELSEKYKQTDKAAGDIYDKIDDVLNDEYKELLDEMCTLYAGTEAEYAQLNFIEGFKIGLLIGKEVFGE